MNNFFTENYENTRWENQGSTLAMRKSKWILEFFIRQHFGIGHICRRRNGTHSRSHLLPGFRTWTDDKDLGEMIQEIHWKIYELDMNILNKNPFLLVPMSCLTSIVEMSLLTGVKVSWPWEGEPGRSGLPPSAAIWWCRRVRVIPPPCPLPPVVGGSGVMRVEELFLSITSCSIQETGPCTLLHLGSSVELTQVV